jgi:hypothetical protein
VRYAGPIMGDCGAFRLHQGRCASLQHR